MIETIEFGLNLKFGVEGLRLMPRISKIQDISLLKTIKEAITTVQDVKKLDSILEEEHAEKRDENT
ncbi:MAG: hypothetical protein GY801_34320 [bacterium]|nr:hypothetical protein [bacterium]